MVKWNPTKTTPWAETREGQKAIAKGRSGSGGGGGQSNNPLRNAWAKSKAKPGKKVDVEVGGVNYTLKTNSDGSTTTYYSDGRGPVTWNPGVEPH
jgi:hypothetical protein